MCGRNNKHAVEIVICFPKKQNRFPGSFSHWQTPPTLLHLHRAVQVIFFLLTRQDNYRGTCDTSAAIKTTLLQPFMHFCLQESSTTRCTKQSQNFLLHSFDARDDFWAVWKLTCVNTQHTNETPLTHHETQQRATCSVWPGLDGRTSQQSVDKTCAISEKTSAPSKIEAIFETHQIFTLQKCTSIQKPCTHPWLNLHFIQLTRKPRHCQPMRSDDIMGEKHGKKRKENKRKETAPWNQ